MYAHHLPLAAAILLFQNQGKSNSSNNLTEYHTQTYEHSYAAYDGNIHGSRRWLKVQGCCRMECVLVASAFLVMANFCSRPKATHKAYTSLLNLGSHDTMALKDGNRRFETP
jgi:hypothetical protein